MLKDFESNIGRHLHAGGRKEVKEAQEGLGGWDKVEHVVKPNDFLIAVEQKYFGQFLPWRLGSQDLNAKSCRKAAGKPTSHACHPISLKVSVQYCTSILGSLHARSCQHLLPSQRRCCNDTRLIITSTLTCLEA
eukprot:5343256-Amphidinium_carterae.1